MAAYKHFTLSDRIDIENYLRDGLSFKAIGREMSRDCTTVAKEIKKHIIHKKTGAFGRAVNSCIHRMDCTYSYSRKKLNNQSPYQLFSFLYGTNALKKLGVVFIPSNKILLKPELLIK